MSVPPAVYGGTEMIIDLLARGLHARGHEVVLFTTGDSTCPVTRRWLHPHALGTASGLTEDAHVERAYQTLTEVDIVHDHTVTGPSRPELHPSGAPVVTTMHGALSPPADRPYVTAAASGVAIVAISHDQRRSAPHLPVAAVIHHGIDVGSYPKGRGEGGYVLFLGRMSPAKGVHEAIEIARAARRRIIVAAKMWEPDEHRYFTERVEPLLGTDAVYVGPVDHRRKVELLGGAAALVNPIGWPEPFGLVMAEALACGTPVLAYPEGAAPEIVEDGRTGFLCRSQEEMVVRLDEISTIDRDACRTAATTRFSASRMVGQHLALYHDLLAEPAGIDLRGSSTLLT
ncbi:MAG: glycosyltransferase family 4 protein [Acidimicrobiales bacterium]